MIKNSLLLQTSHVGTKLSPEDEVKVIDALRKIGEPVVNTRWKFVEDADKVVAFQQWLKAQVQALLIGKTEEEMWQRYTEAGFKKGAGRAFDDTKRPFKSFATDEERMGFYAGTREQFLRDSFARPVAVEKVKLLAGRSFDELENVTADMSNRMSRALTDGLVTGASPRDIADDLEEVTDFSEGRALTVARTEIIRAHAEGQLQALEDLGVEEIGVMVEWSTTDDNLVCPDCDALEGVVLTIEEAHGLLPRHPNCRCAFIPANVGEDKEDQIRGKRAVEEAMEESGLEDVEIDSERPVSVLNSGRFTRWASRLRFPLLISNVRREFFADCQRDEHGHCLPEGGEQVVSKGELKEAQKKAVEKGDRAIRPTKEQVSNANARIDSLGADRYESQIRGNSKDRAASRERLLKEFGDGEECPCVYCGLRLDKSSVTRDKIYTARQGGRYTHDNLVPACLSCNNARGDAPWESIRWK